MQPRVWCLVRGELRAVWGACSVLTRPGKRWEAADQGTPPVDEPRGECAIKWIPLKVTCSVTPPVEQSGKPGLRNREPGSTVEKLPDGAVNPKKGTTQCRNTEFDIRWKCSKVYRVAALVASES